MLLQATASIPFPNKPGMTVTVTDEDNVRSQYKIPGVMAIDWGPTIGYSQTSMDAAPITGQEIYSKVRSVYSGSLDADAPDFVIYLLALDSIFSYIAALKRIYRILTAWSPENYATPDTILGAMGFSQRAIDLLRAQRVQLWQGINELILQSRKFRCPKEFDIMERHYWMNDNVYTDAASVKSQFYVFNMTSIYSFKMLPTLDDSSINAGGLEVIKTPWMEFNTGCSADTLYNFGNKLIQNLIEWDDSFTISGYLTRAFDSVPTFIVEELGQGEIFTPLYNEEVLTQIENAHAVPDGHLWVSNNPNVTLNMNVQQNVGANMVSTANGMSEKMAPGANIAVEAVLNSRSDAPSVADVVVMSRLHCMSKVTSTTPGTTVVSNVTFYTGTEVVWSIRLVNSVPDNGLSTMTTATYSDAVVPSETILASTMSATSLSLLYRTLQCDAFDWHPITLLRTSDQKLVIFGDVHNLTVVDLDTMIQLNKICVLSELNAYSIL